MKNIFIILCVMSIGIACSQQETEDPSIKENNDYLKKGGWKLVWEDDFNRDDIFATGIWSKIWGALLPKPTGANYKLIISKR